MTEENEAVALDRKVRTKSLFTLDQEWRYHVGGTGSPSVLVLSGSLGANAGTAKLLAESLPSARVIVPQYAPVSTVEECVQALDQILKEERVDRVALFGGSFGGLVAQSWACRHPDRVTHLLLSGTAPPDASRVRSHRRALQVLPLVPMFVIRFSLRVMLRILLRGSNNHLWRQEYSNLIASLTKEDLKSRYQLALDFDRNGTMPALASSANVLILEGESDRVVSSSIRGKLRNLYPQARVHVFKGAGHSPIITHTEEWSAIVTGFLAGRFV